MRNYRSIRDRRLVFAPAAASSGASPMTNRGSMAAPGLALPEGAARQMTDFRFAERPPAVCEARASGYLAANRRSMRGPGLPRAAEGAAR